MKLGFLAPILAALSVASLMAAPAPVYRSTDPVDFFDIPPLIDATVWINETTFNVYNDAGSLSPIPYRTQNTEAFTNGPGQSMYGVPGFQFVTVRNGKLSPMRAWSNQGSIGADFVPTNFLTLQEETSLISVRADTIVNNGPLNVGTKGVVRLEGVNVTATRAGLRAGPPPASSSVFSYSSYLGSASFYNDYGIQDLWWGLGTNNVLRGDGDPMFIPGGLSLPSPSTVTHEVYIPDSPYTNFVSLPYLTFNNAYGAVATEDSLSATSRVIQVVFYPTNFADTNMNITVQFGGLNNSPARRGGRMVTVGFHSFEYDIAQRTTNGYSIYLQDDLPFRSQAVLANNLGSGTTRRPSTYSVFRGRPEMTNSFFFGGFAGNVPYTNTLIYNPLTYATNEVRVYYTAYAAGVSGYVLPTSAYLLNNLWDSTNLLGRVDIFGKSGDLDRARIRSESSVVITVPDLSSNRLARVDAPFVNFDVGSRHPQLVVSNLAPNIVRRINGNIHCWSAQWTNYERLATQTNQLRFHVLFVDHNLSGEQPVLTDRFSAKVGSLKVQDHLTIGKRFKHEGTNLTFTGGGGLTLPAYYGLGSSNLVGVMNFTNEGRVSATLASTHFGDDRFDTVGQPRPYDSFFNRGTNTSSSLFIKAKQTFNSGVLETTGGKISIDAKRFRLEGGNVTAIVTNTSTNTFFEIVNGSIITVTNIVTEIFTNTTAARLSGRSTLDLRAHNFIASNSLIQVARLSMAVTNNLKAGKLTAPSTWITTHGFEMLLRPTNSSDLMAVTLLAQPALPFQQLVNYWPAKDLGAINAGFSNNLALGHLILDGTEESVFRFAGTRNKRALYVDYLEFRNHATNFFGPVQSVQVDPNITLYFANANIPAEKLTNSFPGRMKWVNTFTGPLSTTNITCLCSNSDGSVTSSSYAMNAALAISKDIDSDGDLLVNAEDPDPLGRCACSGTLLSSEMLLAGANGASLAGADAASTGAIGTSIAGSIAGSGIRLSIQREHSGSGRRSLLSWPGQAGATNIVEFSTSPLLTEWQTLTNFSTGPTSRRLTVSDELSSQGNRFYRVRVLPPPQ